ncbi:hypothetical protein B0J11DRAFT_32726 [Dendryphion nanum]|uniref:CFEM domain-containing protein n=1 Tax=Dendryphion nanum TaxID=256645 RepID=A0A9P9J0M0_9PLEO|nr:hypothetical protein B0J11DRAFT_32726 [Dendryphion nanum]
MKFSFSFFALAASVALVSAQDLTGIPSCAIACFAVAVPSSGCSLTDTTCQCTTGRDKITSSLMECVPGKCSTSEIAQLAPAVENICKKAGITISNIPTAVPTGVQSGSGTAATRTPTITGAVASQTPGAGVANVAGMGAVAMGLVAAFGL